MKRRITLLCVVICMTAFSHTQLQAQLTSAEAVAKIGRGINLGNTFDAPTEGAWAPTAKETFFDAYVEAGFNSVRMPITWDKHTGTTAPYTIEATFLNRVEEVIDWGLDRDLVMIINMHHEGWLKGNYSADNKARMVSIWTQIADRFKDKSETLFFEMMNEPEPLRKTDTDDLNATILPIIRNNNPTRIVVFSGQGWSNSPDLLGAAIPVDDYLIGYFHSYDPWNFAGVGTGTWGTVSDRAAIASKFSQVKAWSTTNNIPVLLGEFGAQKKCDYNSRMIHYATYVEESINHNFGFSAWDDNGDFQILQRTTGVSWNDIKDILIHFGPTAPTTISTTVVNETSIKLSWDNRSTDNLSISIEKKSGETFTEIADLDAAAVEYTDENLTVGQSYTYRVIAKMEDGNHLMSYPRKQLIQSTTRSTYLATPMAIPGTIEPENFDIGGEGLTYHDTESANQGNAYRVDDGVDIEARADNKFQVGWVEAGEWLEYTVNVETAGTYAVKAFVASQDGGGVLKLIAGSASTNFAIPSTGDWVTLTEVTSEINLEAGEQILKLEISAIPAFNIEHLEFSLANVNASEELKASLMIYPNPATDNVALKWKDNKQTINVEVFNTMGQMVYSVERKNLQQLNIPLADARGIYLLKVQVDHQPITVHKIIRQ